MKKKTFIYECPRDYRKPTYQIVLSAAGQIFGSIVGIAVGIAILMYLL